MESVPLGARETVEVVDGVHLTQLAAGDRMSVQHFHVEPGAVVPEHTHEHEQVGFAYRGAGTFVFDGETVVVGPGESYAIPGGEPHALENRGEEALVGVDVFSPPRLDVPWSG